MGVGLLAILLIQVTVDGIKWLDYQFLTSFPSRFPYKAGIKSALVGTLWLIVMIAMVSIPIGVATALYLEELSRKGRFAKLIEINISNLAGVPSIVYGIIGLAIFVRGLGLERSLLSGDIRDALRSEERLLCVS